MATSVTIITYVPFMTIPLRAIPGPSLPDYTSALNLELESELKRKPEVEETLEMDAQLWSKLPEELLMRVLCHLPSLTVRKFKIVCKSWNSILSAAQAFQQIQLTVPLCLFPAFLIGGLRETYIMQTVISDLYLLQSLPNYPLHKLTLDFLAPDCGSCSVVTTCKSLVCFCCQRQGAPTLLYICNPITRTWKMLPPPIQLRSYGNFIAMAFDPCARRCLLVIGVNTITRGHRNNMVMEIFDSQSYTWTKSEMDMPLSICPRGEGVYSRGRFYWINYAPVGPAWPAMFRYDVVAFSAAEKHWDVIRKPQRTTDAPEFEYTCFWKLTGYDGKVVLVDRGDLSLWKLNEDRGEGHNWSELHAFPRSLYEEVVSHGNIIGVNRNPRTIAPTDTLPQVVINSCGWVLVHSHGNKLVIFDAEGRMMRSIEGKLLTVFERAASPLPVHAYEINNVWWP